MRDIHEKIERIGCHKLGVVLHLGAGTGTDLAGYLHLQADKVILVEANPALADRLRWVARGLEQVEVVASAVAATEGEKIFWVLNNPRESSLHPPANLLKRYPNISVLGNVRVQATTLVRLVEHLDLASGHENLLVMELQGAEALVLSSAPSGILQKFSWIAVRASREALFEGGARLEEVDAILGKLGFAPVTPEQPDVAQPFRDVLYRLDTLQVQVRALKNLLDEREAQIEQLTKGYQEHEWVSEERLAHIEQLTQALTQQTNLAAERQAQIVDLTKGYQEHERVSKERFSHIEQLTQTLTQQTNLAAERQAQIADLTRGYQEHERVSKERISHIEQLTQTLTQQTNLAAERQAQIAEAHIEQLTQALSEQERLAAEHKAKIAEFTKTLEEQAKKLTAFETENHELGHRQRLLDTEVVKAEAQLELIKDVLLREKAF